MTQPTLVVTGRYTKEVEDRIDRDYNARRNPDQFPFTQQKLLAAAEGADALFITPADRLDSEFFEKVSPTVKIIVTFSVGFEHIDREAAVRRKISVAYTPGVNHEATADIAMLLLLGASRRAYEAQELLRTGAWKPLSQKDQDILHGVLIRICRPVIMTRFKSRNIPMALMIASMRRFAPLALTLLVIIPLPTWPQDCVPAPGPSSLLRKSEAVFVGIVTGASGEGTYHLQVTEAIKGVTGDNFEVETVPGTSFSSFQLGKQYLVFAYTLALKNGTEYRLARGCGLTRELKYAQAALEQVRAEKSGRTIASVYGTLLRTVPESLKWDDNYERPLSGIVVRLQSGQKSYMTQTDEYGVYAFTHLPPGTYQVSADLPPALTLGDSITEDSPRPFELPRRSSFDYEFPK